MRQEDDPEIDPDMCSAARHGRLSTPSISWHKFADLEVDTRGHQPALDSRWLCIHLAKRIFNLSTPENC